MRSDLFRRKGFRIAPYIKFQVSLFPHSKKFKHNIMVTKLRNVEVRDRKPMGLKRVHTPSCKRYVKINFKKRTFMETKNQNVK